MRHCASTAWSGCAPLPRLEHLLEGTNQRQTTDDPQIPAPAPAQSHPAVPPPPPGAQIQIPSTIQAAPRERLNYRLRHTLRGHTQSVSTLKFSPDGILLASFGVSALCVCLGSASDDTSIRIWNIETVLSSLLPGYRSWK